MMLEHVRGATYNTLCNHQLDDGTPVNIANITITSQIRTVTGILVANVAIEKTNNTGGEFTMTVADTRSWPVETLVQDIKYVDSGNVIYTEKYKIKVTEQVTA